MHALSKLILEKYQVRKTKEQKSAFIDLLREELKAFNVRVEEGGALKSRNIVIGDINTCEYVLGAHYDTQPVLPFPNFLAPKNMVAYLLYCALLFALFFAIDSLIIFVTLVLTDNFAIATIASYTILFAIILWMFIGKANKHTANDNTSGVITLIEAMQVAEIREKACFVFFDHEEVGLFGSKFFSTKHKDILKDKLVINFDCVGDGDHIMFVIGKKNMEDKEELENSFSDFEDKKCIFENAKNTLYPSDQINFKRNVGVAAFKYKKGIGYYMDKIHTKKDVNMDEKNIEVLIKGLKMFSVKLERVYEDK